MNVVIWLLFTSEPSVNKDKYVDRVMVNKLSKKVDIEASKCIAIDVNDTCIQII